MSTLEKVKELREITGAGMQDCKTALSENNNDIEQAVDFLRKKGILKAAKKSSRDAAEGLVVTFISNKIGILLEINSETDFVAKNKEFIRNYPVKVALVNNPKTPVSTALGLVISRRSSKSFCGRGHIHHLFEHLIHITPLNRYPAFLPSSLFRNA